MGTAADSLAVIAEKARPDEPLDRQEDRSTSEAGRHNKIGDRDLDSSHVGDGRLSGDHIVNDPHRQRFLSQPGVWAGEKVVPGWWTQAMDASVTGE